MVEEREEKGMMMEEREEKGMMMERGRKRHDVGEEER